MASILWLWLTLFQVPSFLTAVSAMLKTPLLELLSFPGNCAVARANRSMLFILMPFLSCIAMRIIRMTVAFLLQPFYFLNELLRSQGTDPKEAGHRAYIIPTDQKKRTDRTRPDCHQGNHRKAPWCRENFTKTWKLAKSRTWLSFQWSSEIPRDYLLLPG